MDRDGKIYSKVRREGGKNVNTMGISQKEEEVPFISCKSSTHHVVVNTGLQFQRRKRTRSRYARGGAREIATSKSAYKTGMAPKELCYKRGAGAGKEEQADSGKVQTQQ